MRFSSKTCLIVCTISFLTGTLLGDVTIEESHKAPTTLTERQPHWKAIVKDIFPDGSPKIIIFIDPTEDSTTSGTPKKLIEYTEDGSLFKESDLMASDTSPDHYVLHGPTVAYAVDYVESISFYNKGKLSDHIKTYHPDGTLASYMPIEGGVPHRLVEKFHPDGQVAERTEYIDGKKSGKSELFYNNGSRRIIGVFDNGLHDGEEIAWYPNEKKKTHCVYSKGLLSGNKQQIALTKYHENGMVAETLDFRQGQPVGPHILYDKTGSEIQRKVYTLGKRELASNPTFPPIEYYPDGKKKREYKGSVDAVEYLEWYPNGTLHFRLHLTNDDLEGVQEEFHPSGSLKTQAFYKNTEKNGPYKEWYSDGSPAMSVDFINGNKHGTLSSWHPNGTKHFEGSFSNGIPTGTHQSWYENGRDHEIYTFANGKRHGPHKVWHENGTLIFSSNYSQDLLDGPAVSFYPDGTKEIVANYKEGKLDGPYSSFYENGCEQDIFQYAHGRPTGPCYVYHPSNPDEPKKISRNTNYVDGKFDGEQTSFYPDGKKQAVLNYDQGVLNGLKASWDEEGDLVEEATYVNGSLHGRFFQRKPDNRTVVYHYKNNVLDGVHQVFHAPDPEQIPPQPPVLALELTYKTGLIEGEVAEYSPEGKKMASTQYLHGKKEGTTELYTDKGTVLFSVEFHNDNQNGMAREFYRNSKSKRSVNFVDDVKEGEEISYHPNGQKATSTPYYHGVLHGTSSHWSPEGILTFVADYDNGKRNGRFNKYDEKGNPTLLQMYRDDTLIEKKRE